MTPDKYELPVAVADNRKILAEMVGTTPEYVSSQISKKSKGWCVVNITDDENAIDTD
ncbi:hypothetical protein NXH64_00975 [Butyrivibrio fibrisolvens]|uniref:hypothetical protein n=1 Tax=Pseudobutyrivibrio ruminis TaxID=46206 RepID=UPI000417E21F|nr:hypothetical protein [Pseudobutyrivibrio ruminis]MDC7278064.1 hypothetical protein [Butyrivibrio fibrisolvens]